MNSENINLIGKWLLILILVGTSVFFAATNRADMAIPFGMGAFVVWFLDMLS